MTRLARALWPLSNALIEMGQGYLKEMLKMQVDPDDLLKTKGERKSKTIDLDGCLKTKVFRDNRGEARILLKVKAIIAEFSANPEPGVRSQKDSFLSPKSEVRSEINRGIGRSGERAN